MISLQDMTSGEIVLLSTITMLTAVLISMAFKLVMEIVPFSSTITRIKKAFPGAMTNRELMNYIEKSLEGHGYGKNSMVASSLCCDEVNRPLEKDLSGLYDMYFAMGGLAGVPFGGVTSFGAMAHHIPDGGSCLVVYGPHVGVDSEGKVGTVNRRGREKSGACCGSAVAACGYVKSVSAGKTKASGPPSEALDAQQTFVGNMLLPHAARLDGAVDDMVELPYALFDVTDKMMKQIIDKGCGAVAGNGKIAMLGGIQINTPEGCSDYFLPLRFDVMSNKGVLVEKLLDAPNAATISKINEVFPRALTNSDLLYKVKEILAPHGYGKTSLLATSLCCDEVNRPLEDEFCAAFGDHFNIGGLAGFAFGGVTGFGAMAHHIPDGGSCLVVYGPHVGVDSEGKVGTVNRRGRKSGGACCGSGVAATVYVNSVRKGGEETKTPDEPLDAQQAYVGSMLLPYGEQLEKAADKMVELPYAMFEAQDKLMNQIVNKGACQVHGNGKIALLGGIQINTPEGQSDYFLPLRFDLVDNKNGKVTDNLLWCESGRHSS